MKPPSVPLKMSDRRDDAAATGTYTPPQYTWLSHVPFTESRYVDGAGQLCTSPLPEWVIGIEPPFQIRSRYTPLSM